MKPEVQVIFAIFFFYASLEFFRGRLFRKPTQTRDDIIVELVSTFGTLGIIQPLVLVMATWLGSTYLPSAESALIDLHWLPALLLLLIGDDLVNYAYHRASHQIPWLYNLHRPHHNGEYMSVRITFRNNIFYYLFAPHLWISGILIYMGLAQVYAVYLVVRVGVAISVHSDICWDKKLYNSKFFKPVMWAICRIINTPSFHHAHHGKHADDGVTHYKGNYANLLSLWDVIFGTAYISNKYPQEYGVENLPATTAGEQLLWPLIRNNKATATTIGGATCD